MKAIILCFSLVTDVGVTVMTSSQTVQFLQSLRLLQPPACEIKYIKSYFPSFSCYWEKWQILFFPSHICVFSSRKIHPSVLLIFQLGFSAVKNQREVQLDRIMFNNQHSNGIYLRWVGEEYYSYQSWCSVQLVTKTVLIKYLAQSDLYFS